MPPILDPALGNPRARALRDRLAQGDWRDAQAFLEGLRVFELRDFFVGVLSNWPGRPAWLDTWCHSNPGSPVPWLIRGVHGVHWAWEARGSTTADKVADGAWPVFAERLRGAESDLQKAAGLDVKDPGPWSWLVTTARALQQGEALERERFEEARRRDTGNLAAHRHFLTALCWKWGGSHEAMFGFAREASAQAPDGSRLHTLVAEAHLERWLAYGMEAQAAESAVYLRTPSVVAEVEAAWRRSLGSPRYASPLGVSDRNLFAFLFWLQLQPARARRELAATGGVVTEGPWQYLGDPVAVFAEAQQETGEIPSRDPALAEKIRGYCDDAVAMTREQRGITLDYGEASLPQADAVLQKLAAEMAGLGEEDRRKATVMIALYHGAHLGEVLRRKLGGEWVGRLPNGEQQLCVRIANLYHQPIVTVAKRVAIAGSDSIVTTFARWVDRLTKPSLALPAAAGAPPADPGPAGATPPRSVADEMSAFAEQAVAEARRTLEVELDYSEASLGVLDQLVTVMRVGAEKYPDERKRMFDMAALKLGAYLGEVLRRSRAGVWTRDGPGLPPGIPALKVGSQYALTLPVLREFLDGRPVDMGSGENADRPSRYYEVVARRQQEWLDKALLGSSPDRERLRTEVADDPSVAETILAHAESALLTAATKWGLLLDFSPESLKGVEDVLGVLHDSLREPERPGDPRPPADALRRMAILWGCYVGEVMRRHIGGRWSNTPVGDQGPVLRLEIGTTQVFPLRKVEKRMLDGPGDAIPFYFHGVRKVVRGEIP